MNREYKHFALRASSVYFFNRWITFAKAKGYIFTGKKSDTKLCMLRVMLIFENKQDMQSKQN